MALPSFSLIESSRSKTWATDILANEDWPFPKALLPEARFPDLSDGNPVGELIFVVDNEGENVPPPRELLRRGPDPLPLVPLPPPPLPPPLAPLLFAPAAPVPPPLPAEGLPAAVVDANWDDIAGALDLGDVTDGRD